MKNEETKKPVIKKKIVYKVKKPLLTFTKKEDPYEPRTKSAPPLQVVEEKVPPKKFVLCRADGTPITAADFSDTSDSSDFEEYEIIPCPECPKFNSFRSHIINDLLEIGKVPKQESPLGVVDKEAKPLVEKNLVVEKEVKPVVEKEVKPLVEKEVKLVVNKEAKLVVNKEAKPLVEKEVKLVVEKEELPIIKESEIKELSTPYSYTPKVSTKPQIVYSIEDIMNCEEVTPFPLILLTKDDSKVPVNADQFRVKKETIYEKVTFELNKLTKDTCRTVIYNIKNLDLRTVKEAKFIGNHIVFNAVREPQYCQQYAVVVSELRKTLKCKEEEAYNKKQTAFFGTVLSAAFNILNEEVKWADGVTLDINSFKNRSAYEQAFEEQETERYAKKKKTLGAVDFVCHLFNLNAIGSSHIKNKLDEYLKIENEEVVEVLARFIDNIGPKLYAIGMSDYANTIINYLSKCKDKYVTRVRFYLMDVLDRKKTWKRPIKTGNTFANMDIEETEEPTKKSTEINGNEMNVNEINISESNSGDILKIIRNIYEDINDADGEEDEIPITDNFKIGCDKYGDTDFFTLFICECITNLKKSKILLPFFIKYFKEACVSKEKLIEIIKKHKENMKELKIDAPLSPKNYTSMIDKLKEGNIIDEFIYKDLIIN